MQYATTVIAGICPSRDISSEVPSTPVQRRGIPDIWNWLVGGESGLIVVVEASSFHQGSSCFAIGAS